MLRHILIASTLISSAMVLVSAAPTFAETGASDAENSGTMKRANPDMRMVLDQLVKLGAKPIGTQSVADTRKGPTPADAVKAVLKAKGQDPVALMANLKVTKKDLSYPVEGGTQAVRIYTPEHAGDKALPVVVYFHGGGWVIADLDTYEASAMAMAHKTNAIFVSVEYRHAPEHKFPAAHDDAVAAYKWVIANAASFGGDPSRIAVAGESAGGNLAANVAIAARDQKLQKPMHMLLVYPVSGTNTDTPSYQKNAAAIPLSKPAMEWFIKNTIAKPADKEDPRLDLVGRADLKALPDATVITDDIDPLMSEGKALAEKLKAAGSHVTYQNYDGVTHEFFGMNAVVKEAEVAQALAAKDLKAAFTQKANAKP